MEGSIAGADYCKMGVNRAILKETLRRLRHNRRGQVVFANIICATRFKFFDEEGTLLDVRCPNGCGDIDSLDRLLRCFNLGTLDPEMPFDDKVAFLSRMARKATKNCPALPIPTPRSPSEGTMGAGEISFEDASSPTAPPLESQTHRVHGV